VVAGFWFVGWFGEPPTSRRLSAETAQFLGWVGILFFGLTTLVGGVRLLDRKPRIAVNTQGVLARDFSDETIAWSQIHGWSVNSVATQQFVCLQLVEPGNFRRSGMAALLGGANRGMGFADVQLNVTGTDRSFAELVDAMQRFGPV